ncbi:hypothetical protein QFZ80_001461 [Paenibacillus sp. V4I7]|nr:hypothetical protein [Paenibacillus sp. V4I7]MDQ0916361.1 hypothetical protein [Paenibacillus sp. V4I5]
MKKKNKGLKWMLGALLAVVVSLASVGGTPPAGVSS